ncbi:MAG TPA: hypothetical protein PLK12_04230 [Prolixibacteraceae bacterium]|nr:hypothetical protein [Prolixibacteraceae bacterium]
MKKGSEIKMSIVSFSIVQLLLFFSFMMMAFTSLAKNTGRYVTYCQVTDKEVIIESDRGQKVLFTAYNNQSIGIDWFDKGQTIRLIGPSEIDKYIGLEGSIYVEEIDELIQITTTSNDGLMIQIHRKPFGFSVFDKETRQIVGLAEPMKNQVIQKMTGTSRMIADRYSRDALFQKKL